MSQTQYIPLSFVRVLNIDIFDPSCLPAFPFTDNVDRPGKTKSARHGENEFHDLDDIAIPSPFAHEPLLCLSNAMVKPLMKRDKEQLARD
jgi:hypothetical protein